MKGTVRDLVTSRGYFASLEQFGESACVPAAARRVAGGSSTCLLTIPATL